MQVALPGSQSRFQEGTQGWELGETGWLCFMAPVAVFFGELVRGDPGKRALNYTSLERSCAQSFQVSAETDSVTRSTAKDSLLTLISI